VSVAVGAAGTVMVEARPGNEWAADNPYGEWTIVDAGTEADLVDVAARWDAFLALTSEGELVASDNLGASWNPVDLPISIQTVAAASPGFVAFGDGEAYTSERTESWSPASGLEGHRVIDAVGVGLDMHAIDDAGAYLRSPDGGETWTVGVEPPATPTRITPLDPNLATVTEDDRVFVLADDEWSELEPPPHPLPGGIVGSELGLLGLGETGLAFWIPRTQRWTSAEPEHPLIDLADTVNGMMGIAEGGRLVVIDMITDCPFDG
jgi:hypothetical protein